VGGQGLVSQTLCVAPLVQLPPDNHEACASISASWGEAAARLQGSLPVSESSSECERVRPRVRAQQHQYYYCIYQITSLSACRRRCKTSLPIGVDAESLTWDMGHGPPVAPELWVQAAAVVIHGAVGLVPVEIELVSALRAAVFLLVVAERHPLAQREPRESFPGRFRHIVALSGPGTICLPSTPCRTLPITYSTVEHTLVLRLECPTTHHQPSTRAMPTPREQTSLLLPVRLNRPSPSRPAPL
jgi:hypothetical protein